MRKITYLLTLYLTMTFFGHSQEKITYQTPPPEIMKLVDIKRPPVVSIDSKSEQMIFLDRSTFKTLFDLNQPELRLGGLRINPIANISSTVTYYNNLRYQKVGDNHISQIEGLPDTPRITYLSYSPDETKMAFTHTQHDGVEVWVVDLNTLKATKVAERVNANAGFPYTWFGNSEELLVRIFPENRGAIIDNKEVLPSGPIISTSDGTISQNRTYQDLLKNAIDEKNFETLLTSELHKVNLAGDHQIWNKADMYVNEAFSPDGKYALITTLTKPFSYVVPYSSFPNRTDVYDMDGLMITPAGTQPLLDNLPIGFMATYKGRRSISWRADKPATLYWVEALDQGDPEVKADYRDELFEWQAPFDSSPRSLSKMINRFAGVIWGNDTYAILYDRWWNTRNKKTYIFNPSGGIEIGKVVFDRNYQDVYNDPGMPQTKRNAFGRHVLQIDDNSVYLIGNGFTTEGQFPFIDMMDLKTQKVKRIYQSQYKDKLEELISIIDAKKGTILTRTESPTQYPNYYVRNIKSKAKPKALTSFENPFKDIDNVHKEVIRYRRADGVELSGTLYLPASYDRQKKEKLPMIMWAYPAEYKDKDSAGQTTASSNTFTFLSYGNPIYWVTRGYAVLDNAAFPIIGEGDEQPNDTFVKQLVDNAKAAIDAVDNLGYIDRNRVAVGGHSYGAFMTANLLTHSDLFAAGIARSGAYNRTLTPFGFQSEERNYWEASDTYDAMSPFMHADKMKTPMLLIHGEADNNSGTHTMQSERYFQALKSFGAPVRLVILPMESHGYAARENVLHLLWEQDQWLEKYVKNKN